MAKTRLPSFGILQTSPFRGVTDRAWTKLQEFGPAYLNIIQNCTPNNPCYTPEQPIEELKAFRLDWYNPQRYVMRKGELNDLYPYVKWIKTKLHHTREGIGYLEFYVKVEHRPAEISARRIESHGGISFAPPVIQVSDEAPIKPEIHDPRISPDFATREEEQHFFSAEGREDREEFQRKLSVMNQAIKDREEAFKWRLQAEALSAYVPFEKALRNLERTYPKLHAVVTSITPEEMADYQDHIKQETMKRSSRELEAELRALPLKNPNAFEDKLLKDE